jgi:hypothetical protein
MRRSMAPRRLLALATLTAVLGGMIGVSAPALARDPSAKPFRGIGAGVSRTSDGFVSSSGTRGMVDPKTLPKRTHASGARPTKPLLSRSTEASKGRATVRPAGVATPSPVETSLTANPPVGQPGVDGFYFQSRPATSYQPPDPWVAAGPDHVIQTVNLSMQILDRSGNLIQSNDLADFFRLPPSYGHSDPRVIFDSLHQRWVMTEVSWICDGSGGQGYIDYLVSSTADPTDPWRLDYFGFNNYLPDYPAPGTSTINLAFAANMFQMDPGADCLGPATAYAGIETLVTDWAEVIRPSTAPPTHFKQFALAQTDYFTPRIAVQAPATSPTLYSVVQFTDPSYPEGPIAGYDQFSGSAAAGTVVQTGSTHLANDFVVAPWIEPTFPQQPGGTPEVTQAIDSRPTDAIWQANKMTWVSTHGCTPTGDLSLQDCVRVTQIDTNGANFATPPTAVQDFLIAQANTDNYYGGIGQALDGTLHVVWTKSDTTSIYPSSYAAYQLPADASNSLSPLEPLKAGSTSSSFTGTRWGDYNGVSQDPQVPNAVWQANMYSGGGLVWNTFVSQLQTGGSSYVGITPLRVVDSRTPLGVTGIFNVNVPRTFQVAGVGGVGGIPPGAVAVTGNVTVTGQTSAGFVAITPTAVVNPTSSTINVPLGDTRANNFTVPLAGNGKLAAVFKASSAGQKAHVIVDITGYFLAGDTHATYNTLPPVRLMDTRAGPGHVGPLNTFHAGTSQQLPVAGIGGVPPNAVAITANLTITGQTKAGLLSVTPDPPSGPPTSSTLNAPLGDTRANGLTVQLNGGGGIWITYGTTGAATAEVLLDVTGYYLQDNTGLLFYPLTPGRILDSRPGAVLSGLTGLFTTGSPQLLDTDGHWGAPAGAAAVTGNLTVVGQTAAGFLAITPASDPAPTTSTMNFPLGDIRANGVTVPLNGSGNMYLVYKTTAAGKKTHVLLDLSGYFK